MKSNSFDSIAKLQKFVEKKVNEVGGVESIEVLFSEAFMKEYTDFNSITEFLDASPVKIITQQDLNDMDTTLIDPFINENSKFQDWEEMSQTAAKESLVRQLREKGLDVK